MNTAKVLTGASAEARATKVDRLKFLENWAVDHPLSTIEQARAAVRGQFGISLGTKILADALRNAKGLWEAKRIEMAHTPGGGLEGQPLQVQVQAWTEGMLKAGVRLIELLPSGGVRLEFVTPGQAAAL